VFAIKLTKVVLGGSIQHNNFLDQLRSIDTIRAKNTIRGMKWKEVKQSHLSIFCYVSYVHINDQKRNEHDPKSKKRTFIC